MPSPCTPYDRRFVAVFIGQLEQRHWPRFPAPAWFAALRFADREADYVRPLNGEPLMSQKVKLKGEPPRDFDWGLKLPVDRAYASWWRKYGA